MKKVLPISITCLFCSAIVYADSSTSNGVAFEQSKKIAEKSNRKKKLNFEFEVGCRARADYFKVSIKKDLKAKKH